MLKLYICIFWEKPSQTVLEAPKTELQLLSRIALGVSATVLLAFGLFLHEIMEKAGMPWQCPWLGCKKPGQADNGGAAVVFAIHHVIGHHVSG